MTEQFHNPLTTLLTMIDYGNAVNKRTSAELHHILIEHVWAELPIDSAASAFISEVAERLIDAPDVPQVDVAAMRNAILVAHEMATQHYIQSDATMRQRIGEALWKAIMADNVMRGFLGYGGPEADRDILGGSGSLEDVPQVEAMPEADWSQAPQWAMWWAVDAKGMARWYEGKPWPREHDTEWEYKIFEFRMWRIGVIDIPIGIDWRTTLRQRPAPAERDE